MELILVLWPTTILRRKRLDIRLFVKREHETSFRGRKKDLRFLRRLRPRY